MKEEYIIFFAPLVAIVCLIGFGRPEVCSETVIVNEYLSSVGHRVSSTHIYLTEKGLIEDDELVNKGETICIQHKPADKNTFQFIYSEGLKYVYERLSNSR